MEELQNALQSILSDPEQMNRVAALAESLGLKPPSSAPPAGPPAGQAEPCLGQSREGSEESDPQFTPRHSERSEESVSPPYRKAASSELPGGIDFPQLMSRLSAMQGSEDRVFAALRSSLSPAGQGKADRALRAAKLSRLAGQFLRRQREGNV